MASRQYSPEVAATAQAALKTLHARFPGARQLVYERRQSLPIGFAPAERGSAVFSLVSAEGYRALRESQRQLLTGNAELRALNEELSAVLASVKQLSG